MSAQEIIDIVLAILAPSGVLSGIVVALVNVFKSKNKLQRAAGKVDLLNEQLKDEDVTTNPKEFKKHIVQVLDEISKELEDKK